MTLKNGVKIDGINSELVLIMFIADGIFSKNNQSMTVTSVLDGQHMKGSKHYQGMAFDIRTYDKKPDVVNYLVQQLKKELDFICDIILEKDHIHVEYDPKPF